MMCQTPGITYSKNFLELFKIHKNFVKKLAKLAIDTKKCGCYNDGNFPSLTVEK